MALSDLEKEARRLGNLKQNKNRDKASIEREAQIIIWKKQIDISSKFESEVDQQIAEKIFEDYLQNYEFQSFSDIQHVADLTYEETLKLSVQKQINKIISDEKTNFVPDKLIATLHDIEHRIWELKDKAGITKTDKEEDLSALQKLLKRLDLYIPFHRNEFTTVCFKCGTPLLLRRKCGKDFENLVHPMFSGRFYFNRRGIELVKAGIWAKDQYAWAFYTSPMYVDWCIENEAKIIEIDGIKQEEIQDFINKNPYLKDTYVPSKILENKKIKLK